jgi:hypothetical protein
VNNKANRELKTIELMINMYCRDNHNQENAPCAKCQEIYIYSCEKIRNCKLGSKKTTCAKCSIHCFKPGSRDAIRRIMRYSGPKMIFKHPVLAVCHLFDSFARF